MGMNIIRDLRDVFSNVEAEGIIVIVQLLKAGVNQRNPLLETFGIFDALGVAVDFGAADVSGVPRHMQHNQHPFNPDRHAGKKRKLQVQGGHFVLNDVLHQAFRFPDFQLNDCICQLKLNFRAGIWVHHKRRIADDVIFRHHKILRTQGKGHGGVDELGICLAEV